MIRMIALFLLAALPLRAEVDITSVTSPGGLNAWLVEERSIPFVAIELVFPGGAALEGDAEAGAVNLMTALLEEGAGDLDAQAFAARSEELATRISFSSSADTITVSARFLTETADAAIEHLRLALVDPRFDPDAIERVRGQVLSSLRRDEVTPNSIATRAFSALAFGAHPYGRPANGSVETVTALDREALVAAHRSAITRDRVYIGAAGDIDAAGLGLLIDRIFGDLPQADRPLPERATFQAEPGTHVVPFEGPQSVIAFGHDGIARDDPEFLMAFVANEVFGGGRFGTRLMREIREQRGLTYGIGAFLASAALGESYQGRVSTDNANVEEVITLLRFEWARMAEEGVSEDELARIKTYLTGSYPLRFDGNGALASIMASMQYQGFDIDYVNRRNALIDAITLDELNALIARLYDPQALSFVVVGQPVGLN